MFTVDVKQQQQQSFATKVLAEWKILQCLNSLNSVYSISSIFSDVLQLRTSEFIHALTVEHSGMNRMEHDRKSWEDIRIQVSLCKSLLAHGQPKLPLLKSSSFLKLLLNALYCMHSIYSK